MKVGTFFEKFAQLAGAPNAVAKMRELVLDLAATGRLIPPECDWQVRLLKTLATKIGSGATPDGGRESYFSEGIPLIRSMNVHFRGFDRTGLVFLSDEQARQLSNVVVQPGDVLLNITGASIGRVTTAPSEMAGARVNQHVTIIRPIPELSSAFLSLFLASPTVQRMINDVQVGATRQALTKAMIEQFEIPVPPLAEQKRIVAKVDELMALCDRLEAQQEEREIRHTELARASLAQFAESPTPANLNFLFHATYDIKPADLSKSILTLGVEGKLVRQEASDESATDLLRRIRVRKRELGIKGPQELDIGPFVDQVVPFELPVGWVWARWESVALKIGDIDHMMPNAVENGVPYVSPRDFLPRNQIDFDGAKRISVEDFARLSQKIKPEIGDLIYPRYGTIGENRLVTDPRDFLASYSCAIIKTMEGFIEPRYQYFFSISALCRSQARAAENKTTQANVGIKSIKSFLIPIPPLAEQRRIVEKVDELLGLVDRLEEQLSASRAIGANLSQAVVAELVG